MNIVIENNTMHIDGQGPVIFDRPIKYAREHAGVVVVILDVPITHDEYQNVFGVGKDGRVVWNVWDDVRKKPITPFPFIGVMSSHDHVVVLANAAGFARAIDSRTGGFLDSWTTK